MARNKIKKVAAYAGTKNLYLNQILMSDGKVKTTDVFSVVTKDMLDTGKLVLIDVEELLALTIGDTFVEFVRLKEVA